MSVTRIFDLLERYQTNFPNKADVFGIKQKGEWKKYSTKEYIELSHAVSYGLLALGLKPGDKVASISANRPEWNFVDMGISMIGAIHVPIFTSLTTNEYDFVLSHSDSKLVFVSDKGIYNKIKNIESNEALKNSIYAFDDIEGVKNWQEIVDLGRKEIPKYQQQLNTLKSGIHEDDFATLIYTSGTTGTSKGVMLSHKNLVQNSIAASKVFQLAETDKYLSILPLCHVGGRMGNYQTQYCGTSLYYAENMGAIASNMKDIKPNGFDAVPRILEKIYDSVISKGKQLSGIKKIMFFWAVKLGLKYKQESKSSWFYKKKLALADKLIFSKWRAALGNNIRLVGCGGAALQPRLECIFWASGIKILNMYGLTETSPVITINRQNDPFLKLGSVGALIDGVELKIADDGEILCKGHNVMLGYYKNEALTQQVIDNDGWFHTGDIGHLEDGKFLVVTDRKKEIFKLSSGKFVAPQVIENKLKESVLIDQVLVIGEREKFASALISPNFAFLKDWCTQNRTCSEQPDEIIKSTEVYRLIQNDITAMNRSMAPSDRIMRFKLVPDEWSPNSGELSPTLKLKRKFISGKYTHLIDQIYSKQAI